MVAVGLPEVRIVKSIKRRGRVHLTRMEVDSQGWKHPRPPADPRLVLLSITLAYVAFVQTFILRPPDTVSARAYDYHAAIAVALLVGIGSVLLLRAAFCRSQYSSWGYEAAGCVAFAGQSAIQFWALVSVSDAWWAATTFAWTVGWGIGNAWRAFTLIRRLW